MQRITVRNIPEQQIKLGNAYTILPGEPYTGEYFAIPTREEQVFHTKQKMMLEDFVVKPIPKNYGLITYNGFEITIS